MDVTPVIDAIHLKKNEPIPVGFSITSYPNPFNPSTTIEVTLPWHTNGFLSIYDVQGRLVRDYEIKNDGRTSYKITWNAMNSHNEAVASGFYLAVLIIDDSHLEGTENQNRKVTKLIYLK
jgi:flagellar hook assembly protein FlgD